MNSFGRIFRLTSFGESHGAAIGGVIDGMEPRLDIDLARVQAALDRRRPGQSAITTQRAEKDRVEVLSGIFEGKTTGTPIGFVVRNDDQRSADYDNLREVYRPSHADYTYQMKYGIRDHRGGGRSSARETIARVVAGAFAAQALEKRGISVCAYASQIGDVVLERPYYQLDLSQVDSNIVRCPDAKAADRMIKAVKAAQADGDTIGGVVSCVVKGVPVGLGEPVFDKLHARLGYAMLGINAAKGFDYGMGFDGVSMRGSQVLERPLANGETGGFGPSGGVQGGISNGRDIYFRVAFKPVATLLRDVETIDIHGNHATVHARGRHDPCVIPRAVPIVEAMAACVVYDFLLLAKCNSDNL